MKKYLRAFVCGVWLGCICPTVFAGDLEEVLVLGYSSNQTNLWFEMIRSMQRDMQAQQAAEAMRRQAAQARELELAEQRRAFGNCMGRAGSSQYQCKDAAQLAHVGDVSRCGEAANSNFSGNINLSFKKYISISLALSPDGRLTQCLALATAFRDKTLSNCDIMWDRDTNNCRSQYGY